MVIPDWPPRQQPKVASSRVDSTMVRQRDRTETEILRYSFLKSGAGLARRAAAVPAYPNSSMSASAPASV